jgi:hypothetical protein
LSPTNPFFSIAVSSADRDETTAIIAYADRWWRSPAGRYAAALLRAEMERLALRNVRLHVPPDRNTFKGREFGAQDVELGCEHWATCRPWRVVLVWLRRFATGCGDALIITAGIEDPA